MQQEIKQQMHMLADGITDERKLQLLMEDMQAYLNEEEGDENDMTDEEMDEVDEIY